MTPMPIKPTCMKIHPFLLHFDSHGSAFDDIAFLVVDMSHLAGVGSGNGMLHLHRAEDHKRLALLDGIAIVHMYFGDGTGHGRGEGFLRMGDIAPASGCINAW